MMGSANGEIIACYSIVDILQLVDCKASIVLMKLIISHYIVHTAHKTLPVHQILKVSK